MTTRGVLATLSQRLASFTPRLPEEPLVAVSARQLGTIFSLAAEPLADRLNTLRKVIIAAAEAEDWSLLSRRDWTQAAWVLWVGEPLVVELSGFIEAYADHVEASTSKAAARRLIYVYLRDFPSDFSWLERVASVIRRALTGVRSSDRLARWRAADDRFAVFNPTEGPDRAADAIVSAPHPLEVEHEIGLMGELSGPGGFAGAVHSRVLQQLRSRLEAGIADAAHLRRLLGSFETLTGLRFEGRRGELADALLLPWSQTTAPADLQRCILEFLISHLKDPRLPSGRWHGTSGAALAIARRWLAQRTLEEFFQIVDRSAKDTHWHYRRAFWLAYFRRGVLDDAWMALGSRAARAAHVSLEEEYACGKLRSGDGAQPSHSLLLMELGGLVIAEWSHNGKCRAWKRTDSRAPRLGRSQYTRSEIIIPSMQIVPEYSEDGIMHHKSETGRWQHRLAEFIYRETNVRVVHREYMPDGR